MVYKKTRRGDRAVDVAAGHVVERRAGNSREYSPWGYDERQYNSPGYDLPVGRLTRTPRGENPEYHTSADDLDLVSREALGDVLGAVLELLGVLENDVVLRSLNPKGEPQPGRRGLYPSVGGRSAEESVLAMLWCMSLADGEHTLLDVARRAALPIATVRKDGAPAGRAPTPERHAEATSNEVTVASGTIVTNRGRRHLQSVILVG